MSPLSEAAKHILVALSHGKLLRVARDGSGARLVDPPRHAQSFGQIPVPGGVVSELQQRSLICQMRTGLGELGVRDTDKAEYWCCRQ